MRYTAEQKAKGLKLYETEGPTAAARQIGCSPRTIRDWAKTAGVSKARSKNLEAAASMFAAERAAVRVKLMSKIGDMLDRMDQPHYDYRGKNVEKVTWETATSGDVKNYAISFGVLLDKLRLELGEATGRTETVDLAAAESRIDQEIARLSEVHDDIHS